MDDLRQDSQTDLPTKYFALCSEHFEALFQQKFSYWDTSRFQEVWETFRPIIDAKGKDSLDNDYPRNEGRLANRFSPINVLSTFLWDPTGIQNSPPPPQKKRFLFELDRPIWNMLSIFQDDRSTTLSNRMGQFRDLSRSTRTCQTEPTTNYQLQKSIFLKGQRNISEQNTSSPNVYGTFLGRKIDLSGIFPK